MYLEAIEIRGPADLIAFGPAFIANPDQGPPLRAADDRSAGTEAIAAVRRIRGAHVRAVLLSGDTSRAMSNAVEGAAIHVASKPVKPDELLKLIADLLAQPIS